MTTEIRKYLDKYEMPPPIFALKMSDSSWSKDYVAFNSMPDHRHTMKPTTTDPVDKLAADMAMCVFNARIKRYESPTGVAEKIASEIISQVRQTVLRYSEAKHPKQTRLYRFMENITIRSLSPQESNIMLHLYRYKCNNEADMISKGSKSVHVANVMAILNLMREKHENKTDNQ
jgi:hypothetical protein